MKSLLHFLFLLLLFGSNALLLCSDNPGKLTGKIYDQTNGSVLPDAVVKIENLNKGTASDLDGKYTIEDIKPGEYKIKVSYTGYTSTSVVVNVKSNEVTDIDFVLKPENSATDTVTIETERINNNEASLLLKQQKSERISDGVSEQQVKRSPDVSTADVMKRVIGVTIVGDKFLFVRGTSERYSTTTLNGVQIPSTEPDKKAFAYDIFPSNLVENLVVSKSFTPDQPGNFSGGLVDITTKDIPDGFTYSVGTNTAFSNNTTTESNFLTYNATQKKFLFFNLGIDNNSRNLPSNFPGNTMITSNYSNDQLLAYSREFTNNWAQLSTKAPLNGGFYITIGDKINVLKNPLGFFAAYSYKNAFSNKPMLLNDYFNDTTLASSFRGQSSVYRVLWGGLLNFAYKVGENNKFSLKNSFVQDAEDATQQTSGYTQDFLKKNYSTDFKQRALKSFILSGEHYLEKVAKMKINWSASYSDARREEPDYKTLVYQRDPLNTDDQNYYAAITTGSLTFDGGSRFFSSLFDINRLVKTDIEMPASIKFLNAFKTKFGVFAGGTRRDFTARLFAPKYYNYTNIFTQLAIGRQSLDSIFAPANIRDSALYYSEFTRGSDSYNAEDNLYSGYFMFDAAIKKLRIVAGARLESYEQLLHSKNEAGDQSVNVNLKNNDILPSVNLTYQLTDKMNIRGSFYQTVSRPEFREIAPFGFTDFTTREFVVGNPDDLHRTLIRNYDLRYEMFPNPGEVLSLSLFYKKIDAPIEQVKKLTSGNNLRTYENAEDGAKNYGMEIEARKNLAFIGKDFDYFSVNTNLSLISSKIIYGSLAGNQERRMQGQAPYSVNVVLSYDNPNSNTSLNILYNRIGDRVNQVGLAGLSDEFERGRNVLDFTVTQKFFKNFELKLAARDLINEDYVYFEKTTDGNKMLVTKRYGGGINYIMQLSYKY